MRPPRPNGGRTTPRRSTRGPVDAARQAAYDVVLAVDVEDAYANLLLPRLLRERGLDGRDAAFATELTYGTLRWQGVLDQVVGAVSSRPVDQLDPPVRAGLRLGAYQLLHLRVPAHAAVHATVQLVRTVAGERAVGFSNAVLRKVAARDFDGWAARLAPRDELGATAFRRGYPRWVAEALLDALDGDVAELDRALAEDRPSTHLVARPGRIEREELLAQAGPAARPGPWSPFAVRLEGGDPAALPAVRAGRAAVQDEGSQLVALALTRAGVDRDRHWLDTCAGPGGKAALLAGLLPAGATLLAADRQPHRARLVAGALAVPAGTATATPMAAATSAPTTPPPTAFTVVADGRQPGWREAAFDRVLVDAPCTGLGALRRRPEVRWRRQPDDVAALHDLQVALLSAAVRAVRPGGVVAYVTCSPHRAETRDVVTRVLAQQPALAQLDARAFLPEVPDLGAGPDVQLWPHRHGTDGMYLALLRSAPPTSPF